MATYISANNGLAGVLPFGSSFNVVVNTDDVGWRATTSEDWIILRTASGLPGENMGITVNPNSGASRTGVINLYSTPGGITSRLIINQGGTTNYISADPLTAGSAAQELTSGIITTNNSASWSATTAETWLRLITTSGVNGGTLRLSVSANIGSSRMGAILLTSSSGAKTTLVVYQSGEDLYIETESPRSFNEVGFSTFAVIRTNDSGWRASTSEDWITVWSSSGTASDDLTFTVQPNPGGSRTGKITITSTPNGAVMELIINQRGTTYYIEVSPNPFAVNSIGMSVPLTVTTNDSGWYASTAQDWIVLVQGSGGPYDFLGLSVMPNYGFDRTGEVLVSSIHGAQTVLEVTQGGGVTIVYPENFSSVLLPVIFQIYKNSQDVAEIEINGFTKHIIDATTELNVSDYYLNSIDAVPLSGEDEITEFGGISIGRLIAASIELESASSIITYLVKSYVPLPRNRFLTDLRKRYYTPGDVDELSAVSDNASPSLFMVMQDDPRQTPIVPDDPESSIPVQYKAYAINTGPQTKRYAVLTNSNREILDVVEFIPLDYCPGVRLCWVNKYGALDYWNFSVLRTRSTSVSKSQIYAWEGYLDVELSAEDEVTIRGQYSDARTMEALSWLISSPKVWLVNNDGSYTRVDITSDKATIYSNTALSALEFKYRPKKDRI